MSEGREALRRLASAAFSTSVVSVPDRAFFAPGKENPQSILPILRGYLEKYALAV
jgi:hypothetical protein